MSDIFLKLHSCCIPVKGASRSAICDLQRGDLYFIPNNLCDWFSNEFHAFNIGQRAAMLNVDERVILDDYVAYIIKQELGWRCSEEELLLFPILDTRWDFPAHISNCIIDVAEQVWCIDLSLLKQLEELCCNYIQIRFYERLSLAELQEILNIINPTQIKAIEMSISYIEIEDFEQAILNFIGQNRKVRNIIISGAPKNWIIKREDTLSGSVFTTRQDANYQMHCGVVEFQQFSINIPHYTESLKYNSCLNRKISIDTKGNIRNCPSMPDSFGNINETKLAEAIEKPGFKKYWTITKDHISKCKDCEFRYICTDCRAYLDDPADAHSSPLKCGYDPYNNQWEDWSTHPLKKRGINYYGLDTPLN